MHDVPGASLGMRICGRLHNPASSSAGQAVRRSLSGPALRAGVLAALCACAGSPGAQESHGSVPGREPGEGEAAGATLWSFDIEPEGSLPEGFEVGATNPGRALSLWKVHADPAAPSAPGVLSLHDARGNRGSTYNLLWTRGVEMQDGSLGVKLRANQGREDRGGGVAWRMQDPDNYYVARWNPLEDNLRAYRVKDGKRVQIASADTQADASGWHVLRVRQAGTHVQCFLDGVCLLDFHDDTFPGAGGVALWTKADAATSFDDLEVREETAPRGE